MESLKLEGLEEVVKNLKLDPKDIQRAARLAINRTAKDVIGVTSRKIAKETLLKVNVIKRRMKVFPDHKDMKATISMLTYDVPAVLAGKPTYAAKGVRIGKHYFRGSFLHYLIRKDGRNRYYLFKRLTRFRYPITELKISIKDQSDFAFLTMEDEIRSRIIKEFERQLKVLGGAFK